MTFKKQLVFQNHLKKNLFQQVGISIFEVIKVGILIFVVILLGMFCFTFVLLPLVFSFGFIMLCFVLCVLCSVTNPAS